MSHIDHFVSPHADNAEAQRFREVMSESEALLKANRVLQSYLSRHAGEGADAAAQGEGFGEHRGPPELGPDLLAAARARGGRGGPSAITLAQEFAAVQGEVASLQKDLMECDLRGSKDVADLNAMLGETRIRINELRKDAYELKRDVVIGAEHPRTKKIMAERVVRFWEEKLRAKDALVDKIHLKNMSLKSQIQKLDYQLKAKEDQGESLHSIDFHQLKIEHTRFNALLRTRNAELLARKSTTGRTVQGLNAAKKRLSDLTANNRQLQLQAKDREDTLQRLTAELGRVEEEVGAEARKRKAFTMQTSANSDVPQVMDYVKQKARLRELQLDLDNWQRKVVISEMALKRARRQGGDAAAAGEPRYQ